MSADSLAGYTRDPFDGFFDGRPVDELIEPGSLLDTDAVRQWFELFHRGLPHSLYTYQLPLQEAPGARSAAFDEELLMFSSYSYLG
ncbi:MAG: hypothetical protein GWM90_24375, partial [Gemmatimonadetes bacterium]|nr:hypothetical protein [Gemmatimonadota bacterium]NIQ57896.1 hypothetical protein [Gemmatimonadota bacterium]NIU78053.1 hypothetical protein [Gammaproteobacteria bacterium]NIX23701.1 hypothetical protein [Actinomycetota bacterium]NIX47100.1 hypothetical protein [Gemmatimonadota bacterium]